MNMKWIRCCSSADLDRRSKNHSQICKYNVYVNEIDTPNHQNWITKLQLIMKTSMNVNPGQWQNIVMKFLSSVTQDDWRVNIYCWNVSDNCKMSFVSQWDSYTELHLCKLEQHHILCSLLVHGLTTISLVGELSVWNQQNDLQEVLILWHVTYFCGAGWKRKCAANQNQEHLINWNNNLRHFATTPLNVFSKTAESLSSNCRRVCSVPRLMFKPDTNQLCGLQYIERIAAVQHCT